MRRKEPIRIGALMEELKNDDNSLSNGMKEIAVLGSWEEVVGKDIADCTMKIYIRGRRLHVHFSSASARSEFFSRRNEVLKQLNAKTGEWYIKFITVF